jgi:hypothetical protein
MALIEPIHHAELRHVSRLTDDRGIFEHARGVHPRFSHGYCTDDNARLLVVTLRHQDQDRDAVVLARVAARFLLDAQVEDGRVHNRMSFERMWTDQPSRDDCWGRAMWGFGTAVSLSSDTELRNRCYEAFTIGQNGRSPYLRSTCFAVLGAAEILRVEPHHKGALQLMKDAAKVLYQLKIESGDWMWPEARLAYANAVIPDAMIAVGIALHDDELLKRGIDLLRWLVHHEIDDDHLSVTPVGGRGPQDTGPMFDQQPIEVSTIADACKRASLVTDESLWGDVVDLAVTWFMGNNDSGESMIDLESGGGFDGLHIDGVNQNQGAESTLAMISTLQHHSSTWLI